MKKRAVLLKSVLLAGIVLCTASMGQVPMLNPEQTVNIASGEMQFSLPLGNVQSIGGGDFPIMLNYHSNIPLSEPSSPVGLGFSYGPGAISRMPVFVPDNNNGGPTNYGYDFDQFNDITCDVPWWKVALGIILTVIGFVLSFIPGVGFWANFVIQVNAFGIGQVGNAVLSQVFSPNSYVAGGYHCVGYTPKYPGGDLLCGKGFLRGAEDDLPDMYNVSTPYVSGQFVWVGPPNPAEGGHFVFKQTGGSVGKDNLTTKINYDLTHETFEITLTNGTVLLFEEKQTSNNYTHIYWSRWVTDEIPCHAEASITQAERVPSQWLLTKVFYPGYTDGDGDRNPETNPQFDKGPWIVFTYDKLGPIAARPLPDVFQTEREVGTAVSPGSTQTGPNTCYLEESYLHWVKTPNQTAEYIYSNGRSDDLWFAQNVLAWQPTQVNVEPAAERITAVPEYAVGGVAQPISSRKVLSSIVVRNKNNETLRTISFSTNYSLRQHSFHSYSKNTSGAFTTLSQNPNAACLTLNAVNITQQNGISLPSTTFNYPNNLFEGHPFYAWDAGQKVIPGGRGQFAIRCYIERRDYWGYFFNNQASTNEFNQDGKESLANNDGFQNAWSVNNIHLPNGQSITWDYEPQRYDAANGHSVQGELVGGVRKSTKFGGGYRVARMTINNNIASQQVLGYYYNSNVDNILTGNFTELDGQSSGYTAVEPFPSLSTHIDDRRNIVALGGIFTPAKIFYEKVAVVEKPQLQSPYIPHGCKVYEFTHAGDPAVPGFHPNGGKYGDADSSWKRCLLIAQSNYDKNRKLVSQQKTEYAFIDQLIAEIGPTTKILSTQIRDSASYQLREEKNKNSIGWLHPATTKDVFKNVMARKSFLFAPDLQAQTPDKIAVTDTNVIRTYPLVFENGLALAGVSSGRYSNLSAFTRTKKFGDPNAIDYVVAITTDQGCGNFCNLFIGTDDPSNPTWYRTSTNTGCWYSNEMTLTYYDSAARMNQANNIVGVGVCDLNSNGVPDIALICAAHSVVQTFPFIGIVCKIFEDVTLNGDGTITFLSTYKMYFSDATLYPAPYPQNVVIVSAVLDDFNGNGIPDLVFMDGYQQSYGTGFNSQRRLHCRFDIDKTTMKQPSMSSPYYNTYTTCCASAPISNLKGEKISRIDYDGDGAMNDLEVTGRGCSEGTVYKIHRTDICNLIPNEGNGTLSFTGSPITFPDYFCLGDIQNSIYCSIDNNVDIKNNGYLGMSADIQTTDSREQKVFAVYINPPLTPIPPTPKLAVIKYFLQQITGDYDGLPNQVEEINSDGTKRITVSTPAYFKYPYMDTLKHMLTPMCQTTVYKDLVVPTYAVSSQATTWENMGSIARYVYTGLDADPDLVDLADAVIGRAPNSVSEIYGLDCPYNTGTTNYGTYIIGYIYPPQTGQYTFYIVSDNCSSLQLYEHLETTSSQTGIAPRFSHGDGNPDFFVNSSYAQRTTHNNWGAARTGTYTLTAGKCYGITIWHKQTSSVTDNVSVGWRLPDGVTYEQPIPGNRFAPLRGNWRPQSSYVWKSPMNCYGMAYNWLPEFNYVSPASSDISWKFAGGITKYDGFSMVNEAVNAQNLPSTTVYRSDMHLPMGSIAGAKFKECGVFTGDYDRSSVQPGFLDLDNGWVKNTGCVLDNVGHFGEKSIKVISGYGIDRTFKLEYGRTYILSAWIKGTGITSANAKDLVVGGTYRQAINQPYGWPIQYSSGSSLPCNGSATVVGSEGDWKFVKLVFAGSGDMTADQWNTLQFQYAHVWVGCVSGTVWIDDVRFYPTDAKVSSTYYDSKWQQPILSVDANNNPGQKVAYDGFGRPVEWSKISKAKSRGTGADTLTSRKSYHLMGEQVFPNTAKTYKIVSRANPAQAVYVPGCNMTNGIPIATYTFQQGSNCYLWQFADQGDGYYYIFSKQNSGFALDVAGIMQNDIDVQIYQYGGHPNTQKWKVIDAGDGCYVLECKNSAAFGMCANGTTVVDNTPVDIYKYGVGYNQQWQIIEVP
jgi:hypothetical protein